MMPAASRAWSCPTKPALIGIACAGRKHGEAIEAIAGST